MLFPIRFVDCLIDEARWKQLLDAPIVQEPPPKIDIPLPPRTYNVEFINGSDFALSVAECPAFDPDDPEDRAPTTWVACAGPGGVETRSLILLGDVSFTRSRSAKTALDLLRVMLEQDPA